MLLCVLIFLHMSYRIKLHFLWCYFFFFYISVYSASNLLVLFNDSILRRGLKCSIPQVRPHVNYYSHNQLDEVKQVKSATKAEIGGKKKNCSVVLTTGVAVVQVEQVEFICEY